jgi:hypothetical protein
MMMMMMMMMMVCLSLTLVISADSFQQNAPQREDCSSPYLNTVDKTLRCYISILYPLAQCSQPVKLLPSQKPQCHWVARFRDMEKPTWR